MTHKVWFITGTSRGFGREWLLAALERGDKVAATARKLDTLKDIAEKYESTLLPLELDVTNRAAAASAVDQAYEHFGQLDVVINNAGYGLFGMVEEVTEAQARAQMETNFFGALWVTQAALPHLRVQKSGHIIQVSSIGGITAFPGIGMYHASKWALEGFSQSLAQEVRSFGIKVTLIEPGGYETDWGGSSAAHTEPLPAYDTLRKVVTAGRKAALSRRGDPVATRSAILKVVDAERPPLRVFFGEAPLGMAKSDYETRLKTWEEWQPVSLEAQGSNA
ncbi:MAG TPA: SDR family oxidoreductase [Polyangiaceae bacterium]|jgi:NAD(P)-dependent dehydrogenase (short-subunit alcohol dehydrogenase family)|nr:SDR family oxidoreductase [Polyangiaceae bacterium]